MDDLTTEITLSSGGRAWAWRELLWTDDIRRWNFINAAQPEAALERIRAAKQRELDIARGVQPGPDPEIVLTDDDIREASEWAALCRIQELTISVARWENVRDPRTNEPLRFPEDLARLGRRDGNELIEGCRAALAEGMPDPNAGGGQSSIVSTDEGSTPNGPKHSRRRG